MQSLLAPLLIVGKLLYQSMHQKKWRIFDLQSNVFKDNFMIFYGGSHVIFL